MNRREFLEIAATGLLMLPGLSKVNRLAAEESQNFPAGRALSYLGESLQKVMDLTTLRRRIGFANLRGPIRQISNLGYNHVYENGEWPSVRNELLRLPAQLANRTRSLLFFGHITDAHLVDEESPARLVAAESYLEVLGVRSAFHPQEDLTVQVLDAMVRTFNSIDHEQPLDFLLNSGDNVDNAHELELKWFLTALEGGEIDPDSGTNQDPLSGPNNDANDPFIAGGLHKTIPFYGAMGNHDIMLQGNVPVAMREIYNSIVQKYLEFMVIHNPTGNHSNAVITPKTTPPDPEELKAGEITPDTRRRGLTGKEFIKLHLQYQTTRPVLGFPRNLLGREFGYYSVKPKSGVPIKMIVLDTTCRLGSLLGVLDKTQYDEFLIPELERAKQENELVMLVAHHPSGSITPLPLFEAELNSRYGRNDNIRGLIHELVAEMQSRETYISRDDLQETLKSYPNVFLYVTGHTHNNKVEHIGESGHGYWEITTSSLLTYPQQSRLLEVVYEGNGTGAVHTSMIDHNSPSGSLAARSRELAYMDDNERSSGGQGTDQDRNAILRFSIPPEIARRL